MLRALNGQPIPGIVVDHQWNAHESPLKVAQLEIAVLRIASYLHVHVTPRTPEKKAVESSLKGPYIWGVRGNERTYLSESAYS